MLCTEREDSRGTRENYLIDVMVLNLCTLCITVTYPGVRAKIENRVLRANVEDFLGDRLRMFQAAEDA